MIPHGDRKDYQYSRLEIQSSYSKEKDHHPTKLHNSDTNPKPIISIYQLPVVQNSKGQKKQRLLSKTHVQISIQNQDTRTGKDQTNRIIN